MSAPEKCKSRAVLWPCNPSSAVCQRSICAFMSTVALLTIDKTRSQPRCPSTDKQTKKMCYFYTKGYYSDIKRWNPVSSNMNECVEYYGKWTKYKHRTRCYTTSGPEATNINREWQATVLTASVPSIMSAGVCDTMWVPADMDFRSYHLWGTREEPLTHSDGWEALSGATSHVSWTWGIEQKCTTFSYGAGQWGKKPSWGSSGAVIHWA